MVRMRAEPIVRRGRSAWAGRQLKQQAGVDPQRLYVEDSGTSMAAPHVSGIIAAFLSIRREYLGRPETVKELLVGNTVDLKRERSFQGTGLVDLMRLIQAV